MDLVFAAHLLLLLNPPYPDPLLGDLLKNSYPSLVDHARKIEAKTFNSVNTPISTTKSRTLLSSTAPVQNKTPDEVLLARQRWGWSVFAVGAVLLFCSVRVPLARNQ